MQAILPSISSPLIQFGKNECSVQVTEISTTYHVHLGSSTGARIDYWFFRITRFHGLWIWHFAGISIWRTAARSRTGPAIECDQYSLRNSGQSDSRRNLDRGPGTQCVEGWGSFADTAADRVAQEIVTRELEKDASPLTQFELETVREKVQKALAQKP